MARARLSKQQRSRVDAKQRSELDSDSFAGIVVSRYGKQIDVESTDPVHIGQIMRCYQRNHLPPLVAGDRVRWQPEADTGVVVAMEDRKNVFGRPDEAGTVKPVAANLDHVLVVVGTTPEPFSNLVDRYLVALENLSLDPAIVFNKADIAIPGQCDGFLNTYQAIGYPVFAVSATNGSGLDQLREFLHGSTATLVGQSGVGKSSLVNALGMGAIATVGGLSQGRVKGTHTTTAARLFHLPHFDLIDSPGIREFVLHQVTPQQLVNGYRELRSLASQCKFRNCAHLSEPGCAVRRASELGEVDGQRMQNFYQILGTLDEDNQ